MSQIQLLPTRHFSPFVTLHDDRPATTSLEVANFFGKRHDDVLKSIRNLLANCPKEFHARNFAEMSESIEIGNGATRQSVFFILYRDGFMLLAMGYTGKKALQIKLAYIEAFNQMEAQLAVNKVESSASLPQSAELLPPSHQAQLKAIVDAKVGMLPSEVQRKAYGEIWSRFSRHFQIARYQQLPSEKMGEAVAYLVEMQISERKSLPQNEQVPAVIKRIDETPFIELAQEIQTAHEAVERILSPLQHKISSLSYFVSKELGKQADVQITCIQDMDIRNCLWGYLSSSLLSGIREAMVYPSRHLEPYANPGYSLLGIVKQLNSARE